MSWLSSLSSQFNQDSEIESESEEENLSRQLHHQHIQQKQSPSDAGGGVKVKENLSEEIRKSIGRQLRGVASFLAPPPQSSPTTTTDTSSSSSTAATNSSLPSHSLVGGIKSDFAEISDFSMSEAQRDHASAVEQLAPSLEDLRYKLCPSFMSEDRFWMIYFIMLYPRLSESDAMLLSTPQIVEVRKVLLQSLQNKTDAAVQSSTSKVGDVEGSYRESNTRREFGTVKQKEVLAGSIYSERQENVDKQEHVDQWLQEEDVETGTSLASLKQLGNHEDVTFSDLEDDDNDASTSPTCKAQNTRGCSPSNSNDWVELRENFASTSPTRKAQNAQDGSPTNSNDWIQLSESSDNGNASRSRGGHSTSREKDSEGEESNDWLNIDDF